jgi:hypothetical protein
MLKTFPRFFPPLGVMKMHSSAAALPLPASLFFVSGYERRKIHFPIQQTEIEFEGK